MKNETEMKMITTQREREREMEKNGMKIDRIHIVTQ